MNNNIIQGKIKIFMSYIEKKKIKPSMDNIF